MESTHVQIMRLHNATRQSITLCRDLIEKTPAHLRETYVRHYEAGLDTWFIDPMELDPDFREILREVDREVERQTRKEKTERMNVTGGTGIEWIGSRGICHFEWKKKKELLKEKYGIDWKSPADLNPDHAFD